MIDPDYFEAKKAELGMDRQDVLVRVQKQLDSWYPGQTRAKSLNNNVLRIVTPNSAVANELRLRQIELLQALELDARLAITIATL